MCACLFAVLAAFSPRVAFLLVWAFTDYVKIAYSGILLPILGVVFLPFTTLIYVLVYDPVAGISGWGWFMMVFAFLLDLSAYAGSVYSNKHRIPDSMTEPATAGKTV